jgi:hypothetical protein
VAIAIISAVTSILGAAVSFFFSMRKEREADWRKIKFEHYREFMAALSSIVGTDATLEGHQRFARACNTVQLVASEQVIKALQNFLRRDCSVKLEPDPRKTRQTAFRANPEHSRRLGHFTGI